MPKGSPGVPRPRQPVEARFQALVDQRGPNECWPWKGALRKGYGTFKLLPGQLESERRKDVYAHRVAFRLEHGRWPDPEALHGCDNPPCCNAANPEHIHEGTPQRNVDEKMERGRHRGAPAGMANHNSRLTQEQSAEIRRRFLAGEATQVALAAEFGVSQITVSRHVRGLRYREVMPP